MKILLFVWSDHRRFRQAPLLLVILSWGINLKQAFRGNYAASFGCTVAAVYLAFRF